MREKKLSKTLIMNFSKSKLFKRSKMQPLQRKDYLKIAAMAVVIGMPLIFGLLI
jgi:hypothetical protein